MYNKLILFFFYLSFVLSAYCQTSYKWHVAETNNEWMHYKEKSHPNDTTHPPKKAAIFSAILPGLGQAYNKKYWKIPIIYTGLGVSGWFIYNNHLNYKLYKKEYIFRLNNNLQPENQELSGYSQEQLRILINQYHRWRDFSIAAAVVIYSLNIIDALVDGYLWRFDADDKNLSFHPSLGVDNTFSFYPKLNLTYNFTKQLLHNKKHEHRTIRLW